MGVLGTLLGLTILEDSSLQAPEIFCSRPHNRIAVGPRFKLALPDFNNWLFPSRDADLPILL